MNWTKLSVTTARLGCHLPCVVHAVSNTFLSKLVVWLCLSVEGWSHRDSPTEATSTHIDDGSSQCDIAFTHTISISCESRQLVAYVFPTSLFLFPHTHTHTHTHTPVNPRILTYLSSSGTHTRAVKTPHRTRDCSKTILYSYEQVSALWFSLYFSHMNTK